MPDLPMIATGVICLIVGGMFGWLAARRAHQAVRDRHRTELQHAIDEARVDPLTKIANRKAFDESLPIHVAIALRYETPLSLVLIDADDLKTVNDRGGHAAGDEALRQLAHLLRGSLREADLLMRLGGDEFALLLPQTDLSGALTAASRILAKLNDSQEKAALSAETGVAQSPAVRASLGVAQLAPEESAAEFVKRTDQALYRAKRSGGNRIGILEDGQLKDFGFPILEFGLTPIERRRHFSE